MTALPARKLEAWRYTDLRELAAGGFSAPAPVLQSVTLPEIEAPRLVFLNGVFAAALSSAVPYRREFAAQAENSALPLALINAEQARDGAVLDIPAGTDAGTLLLISEAGGAESFSFHLRHRIRLGEGAKLTLIELAKGEGAYWHNEVMDIALAENARLTHIRLQEEGAKAYALATVQAEIAAGALYEFFAAGLGAKLSRTEVHAVLKGSGAVAHLSAIQLLAQSQHGDCTFVMRHEAPDCVSRQIVKSVLSGAARGVFQGRIEVAKQAQKTDGYQMSKALLLSPTAEMDIKPELEIFADDVKCSHGATIGALDEEQVFYLRSRGIDETQARSMLIRAFLDEAIAPVEHEQARQILETAVSGWWARQ